MIVTKTLTVCVRPPASLHFRRAQGWLGASGGGGGAAMGAEQLLWLAAYSEGAFRLPPARGRGRVVALLPREPWLQGDLDGLPSLCRARPARCHVVGLLSVVPGVLWDGPLTQWPCEAAAQREYFGNAEDAYTVGTANVHLLQEPMPCFVRQKVRSGRPINGTTRIVQLREQDMVFSVSPSSPLAQGTQLQWVQASGGGAPFGTSGGGAPLLGDIPVVQVVEPVAQLLAHRKWSVLVLLGRWRLVCPGWPTASWCRARRGLHEAAPAAKYKVDPRTLAELAGHLRQWAPSLLTGCSTEESLRRQRDLERCVQWADGLASTLASGPRSARTKVSYTAAAMFHTYVGTFKMTSRQHPAVRTAFENLAASLGLDFAQAALEFPRDSTLNETRFSLECALMVAEREKNAGGRDLARYGWVDSSPQGARNWLLMMHACAEVQGVADLMACASKLAMEPEPPGASEGSRRLHDNLRHRTQVPVALGLRKADLPSKVSAFLHSALLECPSLVALQKYLASFVSFTTDLGVEVGLAGFYALTLEGVLPVWMRQVRQEFVPDLPEAECRGASATWMCTEDVECLGETEARPHWVADVETFGMEEEAPHSQHQARVFAGEPAAAPRSQSQFPASAGEPAAPRAQEREAAAAPPSQERELAAASHSESTEVEACLKQSRAEAEASRRAAAQYVEAMDAEAQRRGMRFVQVPGEGLCQFDALAMGASHDGEAVDHVALRLMIATHLREDQSWWQEFLVETTAEQYIRDLERGASWGDHITLVAAAAVLRRRVVIVRADGAESVIHGPEPPIFVAFNEEWHYDALLPGAAAAPPPPPSDPAPAAQTRKEALQLVFPNAIAVPGLLHIVHNLTADVHREAQGWSKFWPQLQNMAALLCVPHRRERFLATCVRGSPFGSLAEDLLASGFPALHEARWFSICDFAHRVRAAWPVLCSLWNSSRYAGPGDAAEKGREFDPALLTSTLRSCAFRAFLELVLGIHAIVRGLARWAEGCACHEHLLRGRRRAKREQLLAEAIGPRRQLSDAGQTRARTCHRRSALVLQPDKRPGGPRGFAATAPYVDPR